MREQPLVSIGARLVLVFSMLSLMACRAEPEATVDLPEDAPSVTGVAEEARPGGREVTPSFDLEGYLVTLSAAPAGIQNRAMRHDLSTGERETLWTTEQGANISDWTPSPDRQRVAYRSILRSTPTEAVESLVVRDLEVGAEALVVAAADTAISRFAGFVWSPDGSSLAYGRQLGGLLGAAETDSGAGLDPVWELHVVRAAKPGGGAADDRVVWQREGTSESLSGLSLAAWNPESGRAVLTEVATDSGIIEQLWWLELGGGGQETEVALDEPAYEAAPSPDGRWLAILMGLESVRVSLLDTATGEQRALEGLEGRRATSLLWSPDSRWLAWAETDLSSSVRFTDIGFVEVGDAAAAQRRSVPGIDSTALAFSPGADRLLVGQSGELGRGFIRYPVLGIQGQSEVEPAWDPPPDSWAVYWTP